MAAPLPRSDRACRQRLDLLADGTNRLLGGGQPRLEPDAIAVGLHVLRARAAVARRNTAPRAPTWQGCDVLRSAWRGPPGHDNGCALARERLAPRPSDQPRARARRPAPRLRRQ